MALARQWRTQTSGVCRAGEPSNLLVSQNLCLLGRQQRTCTCVWWSHIVSLLLTSSLQSYSSGDTHVWVMEPLQPLMDLDLVILLTCVWWNRRSRPNHSRYSG